MIDSSIIAAGKGHAACKNVVGARMARTDVGVIYESGIIVVFIISS